MPSKAESFPSTPNSTMNNTITQSFLTFLFVFCSMFPMASIHGNVDAVLVSCDGQSPPEVRFISETSRPKLDGIRSGLLFFPPQDASPERWLPVGKSIPSLAELQDEHLRTLGPSRGITGAIADSIPAQTVQLEQLTAFVANRSLPDYATSVIFSPAHDSVLLNPCPTLRRLPQTDATSGEKKYPAVTAIIFRNEQPLLEIRFDEGRKAVAWDEIPELPGRFQEGLPPGVYSIRIDGSNKTNRFTVKYTELFQYSEDRFARIESLLGKDDPVAVQIAADTLAQDLKDGPFFTDALDRIAALPKEKSTPYLDNMYSFLTFRMTGLEGMTRGSDGRLAKDETEKTEEANADVDPVAAAALIHRLLLGEKWSLAANRLENLEKKLSENSEMPKTEEIRALCHLYRGMILAESGAARLQDGYAEFDEAMRQLDAIAEKGANEARAVAASRYRVANNFGNYLLRLTQDRLYNHTLAIATGDGMVMTDVLYSWSRALVAYRKALDITSESLGDQPELIATTKANLARLYAVLGDIVRTVDLDKTAGEIETSAYATASKLAGEVIDLKLPDEDRLLGAVHHLLADIAFRQNDRQRCRTEAELARKCYVRTGTLSGVEAVERLLGMIDTTDRAAVLKHLSISSALSEALLQQVPEDKIGLSRAGFFARRAYVNERLIELLLQEGKTAEALQTLEAAKGRSLQTVLAGADLNSKAAEVRSVSEILADWPKDVAAVEYFVGTEKSWGFLIVDGKVEAFPIVGTDGKSLPSRDLIAAVQRYLSASELQAKKMSTLIRSGQGFGREWESTLFQLRTSLLPDAVLAKIRSAAAKQVLIVPQHILHYLPFAALVVKQDTNVAPKAMPMPTFLLDEPFDLFYAPSLVVWDTLFHSDDRPVQQVGVVGVSHFSHAAPLGGVKKDIENLQNAFGKSKVETIVDDAATKSAFKTILQRRGLLLVATHGTNCPEQPLYGRLALRSGTGDDDAITAEEIYRTTVGADLVVLSACYSGLADQTPMPGDDLFGIQRALLHGGARSVVAGVWDVYDSTGPMIVKGVMQRLAEGQPITEALNGSQRDFLAEQRAEGSGNPWTHPYFWAVYTLTGDGRVHCSEKK